MPTVTGATQIARMITRPSTADVMELLAESNFLDLEMDEIHVRASSPCVGVRVLDTGARKKHALLVIAMKQADGKMVFNLDASHVFGVGDAVIVMGRASDIESFRRESEVLAK